jgi:Phosphate-selective porin O and P
MKRRPFFTTGRNVVLVFILAAGPAQAQAVVMVNDTTFLKLGVLLQSRADWQEFASTDGTTTTGYAQNLFIRRFRFLVAGQVLEGVTFFYQLDNSNLGKNKASAAALANGLNTLDAFAMWKLIPGLQLQAGLFYVPMGRNVLTASSSALTLDTGPTSLLSNAQTQGNEFRDTGLGATGFFLNDHLQYRAGVFQGERLPGSKNSFRYAARVQYEFFDTETGYLHQGYVYQGTNWGEKKIVAIGAGSDNQGAYHAYAADAFADIPTGKGDAVTGSVNWFHYDGETRFATLPRQNDYLFEAGYYFSAVKLQPFLQFHGQSFSDAVNDSKSSHRYQAGLHYLVSRQNLKLTAAYTRLAPKLGSATSTNEFTIQLQVFYF